MYLFRYTAIDVNNNRVQGSIAAESEKDAIKRLKPSHQEIIKLVRKGDKITFKNLVTGFRRKYIERVGEYPLLIFTKELALMLKVGIPIDKSYKVLAEYQENAKMKRVLEAVNKDIKQGITMSNALAKHPGVFPPIYCALSRVGESTGKLDFVLEQLYGYQEKEFQTRRRIQAALLYPCFVMGFTIIILTTLMIYYIPSFIEFLEGMEVELPVTTQILMSIVNVVQDPVALTTIILVVLVFLYGYYNYSRTLVGKFRIDELKLKFPVLGEIILLANLTRFARTFALMYKCGVGVHEIMKASGKVVESAPLQDVIEESRLEIYDGESYANAIGRKKYIPPLMRGFLAMGEETGDVIMSMETLAEMYDSQVTHKIDCFISLLEPIFMGVIAFFVGFVSLSLFLPIYSLIGEMGA